MTNSEGNNSDRLDRIERLFEQNELRFERNELRVERMILRQESDNQRMISIERTVQAMLEQQATDRLKREEEKAQHEERMSRLEDTVIRLDDTVARLTRIEEAQNRMLASMDEDRPTVLRKLTAIENKVDILLERDRQA